VLSARLVKMTPPPETVALHPAVGATVMVPDDLESFLAGR